MLTCEFEQLAIQYDTTYNQIHSLLSHLSSIPSIWRKDDQSYYIVSISAKRLNTMQLTLFRNNVPVFDMLRSDFKDFSHELTINECTIEQINYIN